MSNISDLYDEMVTRVSTVLSSHKRLTNPYKIEQNTKGILTLGWGIRLGPMVNSQRTMCPKISLDRDTIIIITRKFIAQETAVTIKADAEKNLMEDQLLVVKDLCDNSNLSGVLGNVDFLSSSEIIQIFGDKDNFIALESTFKAEVFETI